MTTLVPKYSKVTSDNRSLDEKFTDELISVKDYGATGDGVTDDLAAITLAIASAPDGSTILFPSGTYNISRYIPVLRNNIRLLGVAGATINSTSVSAGYPNDGIRVGNMAAVEGEGGTNAVPYTYTSNIIVDGISFTNCRIGVWFVYSRDFLVQNIRANGIAAVACGNDGYDDCDNFTIRNITMTGWTSIHPDEFYIVGVYRSQNFTVDSVYQLVGMTLVANASAIQIESCSYLSVVNCHIDQKTKFSNGITITGSVGFNVSDCTVINAKNGFVTFPGATTRLTGTITGNAINCTSGVQVYAEYTTFENIYTSGCTYDLALQTDAALNLFQDCKFNPTGSASVFQEIPTGNNGINLQRWRNNSGVIMGTANGYFGGLSTSFRAAQSTGAANVTGDGTDYVVALWTKEFENNNGTAMFDATTGIFTAPITGLYRFEIAVSLSDAATSGFTSSQLALTLQGSTASIIIDKQFGANNVILNGSALVAINRGATARLTVTASGGTKTADIPANAALTYWSGMLVA